MPKPETLNPVMNGNMPKPETLNPVMNGNMPKPETLNPKAWYEWQHA